ncbi:peptidase inhibitor family I36 protein [Alloactinosynnema sp. L-07]|uniref:peptidase inhibitor family I36 protein n=1 Tax=Alloactinosynnema sp. L-07 TaxID=1653480 RepID=UPI0015619807|nr:peptidase inhibitor family I36 protein [Alloactinosynnema sp. L-07]
MLLLLWVVASLKQERFIFVALPEPSNLMLVLKGLALLVVVVAGFFIVTQPVRSAAWMNEYIFGAEPERDPPPSLSSTSLSSTTPPTTTDSNTDWQCSNGYLCVWNQPEGLGKGCRWDKDDPDWLSGSVTCSWIGDEPVKSVFNNSSDTIAFYRDANFQDPVRCVEPNEHYTLEEAMYALSQRSTDPTCPEMG